MPLPAPPPYGTASYWDVRYAADPEASFDWYCTADELIPVLETILPAKDDFRRDDFEVFVPGCGNSTLPARLHAAGMRNVSAVDQSPVVIAAMQERYASLPELDFSIVDCVDMREQLEGPCFDLIVDKALLDSLLCAEDGASKASAAVQEMYRLLNPGGVYVVVSFAEPERRQAFLLGEGLDWEVSVHELAVRGDSEQAKAAEETAPASSAAGTRTYFAYFCRKPGLR
jgi:SAM-dependent methyltransferase